MFRKYIISISKQLTSVSCSLQRKESWLFQFTPPANTTNAERLQLVEGGLVDQEFAGPRQAISAGEKFRQRQMPAGTSRHWLWYLVVMGSSKMKKNRPDGGSWWVG